jgi:glycosyltransferase involved in cell wall biosynthesis
MFLSADSCTASSQIKYDEYIKEIYRIVKLLPGKKLVIKSHPSQILRKFVQGIIDEIDPTITMIETMDNVELFSNCELLITFNNSTTTLEAMSVKTPVISLQTDSWAEEEDIAQSDAIISIAKISECEDAIKKVLYNTQFREELLEKGNKFLSQYMSNNGNASENITNILKMQQKE